MSPEKARVLVIEDNPVWRGGRIPEQLEEAGHTIVASPSTLKAVKREIKNLVKNKVQVVTLDTNLGDYPDSDNYYRIDGLSLIPVIRKSAPEVKIISLSLNPIEGADKKLNKTRLEQLGEIITNL